MRGWKVAAVAIGAVIAFFVVMSVVHVIIGLAFDVLIAALVAGGIYVAIKMARSGKEVSGKQKDSEIRDRHSASNALSGMDLDQYTAPAPPPSRPAQPARPSASDIDDELARLKREMGS
jgi:hypothetical protein